MPTQNTRYGIIDRLRDILIGPIQNNQPDQEPESIQTLAKKLVEFTLRSIQNQQYLPHTSQAFGQAISNFQNAEENPIFNETTHRTLRQRILSLPIVRNRLRTQISKEITEILKTRANFIASETIKCRLTQNFTRQAKTDTPVLTIFFSREVIEYNFWYVDRVSTSYANVTPTFGFVGSHMNLKAMAIKCRTAVIANRTRQEVILNVRPLNTRPRADEAAGLEMITRA